MPSTDLEQRSIDALRVLAMDAVLHAGTGKAGVPMAMADIGYVVWTRHLRHNPRDPLWHNRDRFLLSEGQASILLYSLLYLTGYPVTVRDLQRFGQLGSQASAQPERNPELGIEATTGPSGQGLGIGLGMAIAARHLAARFNREGFPLIDHWVYSLLSSSDVMEGISYEAASLAGHLGLERLVCLYAANDVTQDGPLGLAFSEDVAARFQACGWHTQDIDGHHAEAVDTAIRRAKTVAGRPHLIICRTEPIGDNPNRPRIAGDHTRSLSQADVVAIKKSMDWPSAEPFYVPNDIVARYRLAIPQGERAEAIWHDMLTSYANVYPEEAREYRRVMKGDLPDNWSVALPRFSQDDGAMSTKSASARILRSLAPVVPELVGGSADLGRVTGAWLDGYGDFSTATPEGRNLRFGNREHAMGAVLNGMALHGGVLPYGSTRLVRSDYLRPAARLAAMMQLTIIYLWSHDSVLVGDGGPTRQPVEHLASLRAVPDLIVIRPADANETLAAWRLALDRRQGPVALILGHRPLPVLPGTVELAAEGVNRGAYILSKSPFDRLDLILIATGSQVADVLAAQSLLAERRIGARVVSMPSWRLFDQQPIFYRLSILPEGVTRRLAVEAGATLGWERYVGSYGAIMGVDRFGLSGSSASLRETLGFTPERIAARAQQLLAE